MKTYELPCYTTRKSHYGKAQVIEASGVKYLKSYNTIVASIDKNGNLFRNWDGYSKTTMEHVYSFMSHYNLSPIVKKDWDKMDITKYYLAK